MKRSVSKVSFSLLVPAFISLVIFSLILLTFFPKASISTQDLDGDGCDDLMESFVDPKLGGQRDPTLYWDFYDVPDETGVKDGEIDLFNDIFAVINRFGASDNGGTAPINRYSDPETTPIPPPPAYHPAFDRSTTGGGITDVGPPDGEISLFNDIFPIAFQFGHSCKWDQEWFQNKGSMIADFSQQPVIQQQGEQVYEVLCYESQEEMDNDAADGELYPPCTQSQIQQMVPAIIAGGATISEQDIINKLTAGFAGPIPVPLPTAENSIPAPLIGEDDDPGGI